MKEYYRYVKKWQDLAIRMNEAMQKDDFRLADRLIKESNETYEKYKECSGYPKKNNELSFGELNYMLESELPKLFTKDRKALKECVKLIKEDKNLLSQFKFIDSLRRYSCDGDAKAYVMESVELAKKNIDRNTVKESVNKFGKLLAKHEIGGIGIDEDTASYFRNCEKVLTEDKKLTNLTEYTNAVNSIADYVGNHKASVVEDKDSIEKMTEDLEMKMGSLTEEEQSIVKDIIDFKKPRVEENQRKLFGKFKNECMETISRLMTEAESEDDKDMLRGLEKQIDDKEYCKDIIVKDIAQMLEIKDILLEK